MGIFNHDAGTVSIAGNLTIANNTGSAGTYTFSAGSLSAAAEYIGNFGTAALFVQNGGTNTSTYLCINNQGRYNIYGGALLLTSTFTNSGTLDFCNSTGTMTVESGIVSLTGNLPKNTSAATLNIGANALLIVPSNFSSGFGTNNFVGMIHYLGTTLTVADGKTISSVAGTISDLVDCQGTITAVGGGGINLANGLKLSGNGLVTLGTGNLAVSDSTSTITGGSLSVYGMSVGNSSGTFSHSAGTVSVGLNLDVTSGTYGLTGSGVLATNSYERINGAKFVQTGGSNTAYGLIVAQANGSTGNYTLGGGSVTVQTEVVGGLGNGTFSQTGGVNTVSNWGSANLTLGSTSGSKGTYTLSGGTLNAGNEIVGYYGLGTVTQLGGTNNATSVMLNWSAGNTKCVYNLSNGALNVNNVYLSYYASAYGDFEQSGGTNTITGKLYYGNGGPGNKGLYNLTGGELIMSTIEITGATPVLQLGGGTITASNNFYVVLDSGYGAKNLLTTLTGTNGNVNIDTSGYSMTLSGTITGPGGINKYGNGVLTLSGTVNYTGNTNIYGGSVNINDASGSKSLGAINICSGGTLSGTPVLSGALDIAGTLKPGNSPGVVTVNNNVTFEKGSTFFAQVYGATPGTQYDQLVTSGSVSLAGALQVDFGSFSVTKSTMLFLIDNTGTSTTTGRFQYADNQAIGTYNGVTWYITYDADNGTTPALDGGNDVAIYAIVPEPSTAILLAGVLGVFAAYRGLRRNRKGTNYEATN